MKVCKNDIGKRADQFVLEKLKDMTISRTFLVENWNTLFLLINDKKVKPSYRIREGDKYWIDEEKIKEIRKEKSRGMKISGEIGDLEIVYEDSDCLVVNKQSGVVIHPGVGNREGTLANFVKGCLEKKGEFDSNVKRAGIVHRLDKGVSGLVLFAKNSKSQICFQKQFENHTVQKIYHAKIENGEESKELKEFVPKKKKNIKDEIEQLKKSNFLCDDSWMKVEGYIGRSKRNRMKMEFTRYEKGGSRYSLTYIRPLSDDELLIKIETGRMHQIRATLEYLGVNIVGDTLYKSKSGTGGIPDTISLSSVLISLKRLDGSDLTISLY
ncbi:MAG: RluA family pseudouridine synthase [Candidatus Dojkabacteria bacterium]|jgi:23S rRNA pseudouridine1911/1915/1917 synthase